MIEVSVIQLAQAAVGFVAGKAIEGALQTAGGEAYKSALERLKGFFSYKFAGRVQLEQMKQDPSAMENLIVQEAQSDMGFREELEALVKQLQDSSSNRTSDSNTNIGSVVDSSVSDSDVVGNSLQDIQVGNTQGSVNIGGKMRDSFRQQ